MKYIKLKTGKIIDLSKFDDYCITSNNGITLTKNDTNYYISEEDIDEIH